ncbi:Guanine nucleotide-binding protein alpha-2 subunit [Monosporozyma unispora]|nr:Guanine nucleotide-binding protein alpha-2 subunit [Kazachstania unispora]
MGVCGSKEESATTTGNSGVVTKKTGSEKVAVEKKANGDLTNKNKTTKNDKDKSKQVVKEPTPVDDNPLNNTKDEEMKVLLLGAGESGKSTILQQLKILHQNGFSDKELVSYIPIVYSNLFEIGRDLINARNKFEIDSEKDNLSKEEIENFVNYNFNLDTKLQATEGMMADLQDFQFPPEFADTLGKIWESKQTQDLINGPNSSQFYLMDSAAYFLEKSNLARITEKGYKPTLQDVLRSRQKTSGIFDTHINMGSNLKLHFFDVGGQRSERKKWIHCFDNVALVIFCVSLSEYDQFLVEDTEQNRFQESLVLFDNIVNSRWFARTSIVLFLNKIDLFAEKLKKKPLENYFPDYNGGDDINKATKYILWRFVQLNRANLNIYPHVTQATDTSNIKLVFAAIKESILENSLKDTGMLQ